MKGIRCFFSIVFVLAFASLSAAQTIHVPADHTTIQEGIDAAADGDTILVADGTYAGNLDFGGKQITVRSENGPAGCIIDCEGSGQGFIFQTNETADSVVEGFTIRNAQAENGGGIFCTSASPTVRDCVIHDNSASYGGGIYAEASSSPTITDCIIRNNSGGGIYVKTTSSPTITNCVIRNNSGGGVYCDASSPAVTHCTIVSNSPGSGVFCISGASPVITNCILRGNAPKEIEGSPTVTYSAVQDGYSGQGNIDISPEFADPGNNDYHLSDKSPCIGAGTTVPVTTDIEGNPRPDPDASNADMGAYESPLGKPMELSVTPATYQKVPQADGEAVFTVANIGDGTMNWTASESLSWLSITPESGTGDGSFTVSYDLNNTGLSRTGTITVTAADAAESPRTVEIRQDILASPFSKDFGDLGLNKTGEQLITILNDCAEGDLVLSDSIRMVGEHAAEFGIEEETCSPDDGMLSPGEMCEVTVTFSPITEGAKNAFLNIPWADPNPPTRVSMTGNAIVEPILSVTPASKTVSKTGATTTFSVQNTGTGTFDWEASEVADWFSINPASGTDNGIITVTYYDNPNDDHREGTITITAPGAKYSPRIVTLFQEGKTELSVSPSERNVSDAVGQTTFDVLNVGSGTMNWTAAAMSPWLELEVDSISGQNSKRITVNYEQNTSEGPRTGEVKVTASGAKNSPQTVKITQSCKEPELVVSPTDPQQIPASGGNRVFTISKTDASSCKMDWSVSELTDEDWLTISPLSGTDSGIITVTADSNPGSERSVTIKFSSDEAANSPLTLQITQLCNPASLSVSETRLDISPAAESVSFNISNGGACPMIWEITEDADWISVNQNSGTDDKTVTINVQPNPGEERETAITITSADAANSPRTIEVVQSCNPPVIAVSPDSLRVSPDGGELTFDISNDGVCQMNWQVTESEDWISLTGPVSGTESGTVRVSAQANSGTSERSAAITITADGATDKTVTVFQSCKSAGISLFPDSLNVSWSDENGENCDSFEISNSGTCPMTWEVSKDADWISSVDPVSGDLISGTDKKTITVCASLNSEKKQRSAEITVTNPDDENSTRTLNLIQACSPPVISLSSLPLETSYEAGCVTFDISNDGGCPMPWEVEVSEDADWITSVEPASGTDSHTLSVCAAENSDDIQRTATIKVISEGAENTPQTVDITQFPQQVTLSVSPNPAEMNSADESLTLTVQNKGTGEMHWEAAVADGEAESWLTIESGGSGDILSREEIGQITLRCSEYFGETLRTGTVVVTAEGAINSPLEIEVKQYGIPMISVTPETYDFGNILTSYGEKRSKPRSTSSRGKRSLSVEEMLGAEFVPNQVIVKKKDGRREKRGAIEEALKVEAIESFSDLGLEVWSIGVSVEEALTQYWDNPIFEYIEPNYKLSLILPSDESGSLSAKRTPDDPDFSKLWGLHNTGQSGGLEDADIDMPEAWEMIAGGEILIAVIDTGVDYTHPDLADNMWINAGEIPGNDIDDDNNGYVDDIHGYDFANNDGDPADDHRHGTHCAGTIAASGNNETGIIGVNPQAKIMALKFLRENGFGDTVDAIRAIQYAVTMGAKILNNSWGGDKYSNAMYDAISAAADAGLIFVAAAGNDSWNNDNEPCHYPSGYDLENIIAVAATTDNDELAAYSNYGAVSVDLGAPGTGIYSTIPGGSYDYLNGSSMAAPHVSGVASLILAAYQNMTPGQVKESILSAVDRIDSLNGKTVSGGRLNADQSLAQIDMAMGRRVFTVSNNGGSGLEITRVSISPEGAGDFSIHEDTCSEKTISAGASCTVKVAFSPVSGGRKTAWLNIESNDPNTPEAKAEMTGEGMNELRISKTEQGQVEINDKLCEDFPCFDTFSQGDKVELKALPAENFDYWSGDIGDIEDTKNSVIEITMNGHKNITANFEFRGWEANIGIRRKTDSLQGVSIDEWVANGKDETELVNAYTTVIGVTYQDKVRADAPPDPSEYAVKLALWDKDEAERWQGPFLEDIRKEGESYEWILDVNPHGNAMPPGPCTSTIHWSSDTLSEEWLCQLKEGYDGNGDEEREIVVPNMKETEEYEVSGRDETQYFTVECFQSPVWVKWVTGSQTVEESDKSVTITAEVTDVGKNRVPAPYDITVPYTVSGEAEGKGTDHDLPPDSKLVIRQGESSGRITFNVTEDALCEETETIILDMGTPTHALKGDTPVHTISLEDVCNQPVIHFETSAQTVSDEDAKVTITAVMSKGTPLTVTVPYTVSGSADYETDHNLADGVITIPPDETSRKVIFDVLHDDYCDGDETIMVKLGMPTNAVIGTNDTHTVTIEDCESEITVEFSEYPNGDIGIVVTLDQASDDEVVKTVMVDGKNGVHEEDITIPAQETTGETVISGLGNYDELVEIMIDGEKITIYPNGDVDHSGETDLQDAILVLKVLAGFHFNGGAVHVKDTDVNGDGDIGLAEALYVLKRLADE